MITVLEGEEKESSSEKELEEAMAENFPNLTRKGGREERKERENSINLQTQEAEEITNRISLKKSIPETSESNFSKIKTKKKKKKS